MKLFIKQFAQNVAQSPQARRRLERLLSRLTEDYFAHPSRRDGRGRKSGLLRKVEDNSLASYDNNYVCHKCIYVTRNGCGNPKLFGRTAT